MQSCLCLSLLLQKGPPTTLTYVPDFLPLMRKTNASSFSGLLKKSQLQLEESPRLAILGQDIRENLM